MFLISLDDEKNRWKAQKTATEPEPTMWNFAISPMQVFNFPVGFIIIRE